jgi:hypothetical protein
MTVVCLKRQDITAIFVFPSQPLLFLENILTYDELIDWLGLCDSDPIGTTVQVFYLLSTQPVYFNEQTDTQNAWEGKGRLKGRSQRKESHVITYLKKEKRC